LAAVASFLVALLQNFLEVTLKWDKIQDTVTTWVITEGPRILLAIICLFLGLWLIKLIISRLHKIMEKRSVDATFKPFLIGLINVALDVLLFLALIQVLGLQLTLFASLIASFGVAVGLALSGTLQNFTSGILILLLKPYRVGDSIIAQGQEGRVEAIEIFYTVVTTYDNKTVIIPNSKLSNEVITNISREGTRRLDVEFKFNYGIDYRQVEEAFKSTISGIQNILKEPQYRIGVSTVEPDGYRVMVSMWLTAHGFIDAKLIIQEKLIQGLKTNGIKLPGM
jgi:small conductance mechanosensitive channel